MTFMWTKLQFKLLYSWVRVHSLLPMRVLYVLSDVFYVLIYRVARYRLKVVRRNMKASFPEKSKAELRKLERAFYHHFADYVVEVIKLGNMRSHEAVSRAHIKNPEMISKLLEEGHTTIVALMAHYGNWEWFTSATMVLPHTLKLWQIYRPLKNKVMDDMFADLRSRFGSFGLKKNDTVREMVRLKREGSQNLVIFIADQTPSKANLHYWTTFLSQDTPMLNGAERIARKLDLPVVFLDVEKVRRGYYTMELKLITSHAKETAENEITETYAHMTEAMILRNPAYWLWTHKRWKYKRDDNGQHTTDN